MQTTHPNSTNPSRPLQLSGQANDMIRGLGGDPEAYAPEAHRTHGQARTTQSPATGFDPLPATDGDRPEDTPPWLNAFIAGELDVETLADHLARMIQNDPRFMQRPWWSQLVDRLTAYLPEWLIGLADAMAHARHRLRRLDQQRHKAD